MTTDVREGETVSSERVAPVGRAAKIVTVLVAVLFGLLIFEVGLRVAGYTYPLFYQPDPARGYALRPGVQGWYRKEGEAYVRINGEGLRDREHEKAKAPGTFRIALLGDSYAEALQVAQEETFWSVAERRLNECGAFGGRKVEFVNFGVSGYGTGLELITLREKVWDYRPDLVLLAFTTNNDVIDNSRALKGTDEVPYFVLRGDELVLDDSFRETRSFRLRSSWPNRAGRWLRDNLRFVQALHHAHTALKHAIASRRAPAPPAQAQEGETARTGAAEKPSLRAEELGAANMIYVEPADEVWREGWRVTEALLLKMRDEVRAGGASFMVVTLSNGIQVHPEPAARRSFVRRIGAEEIFYPDLRIKSLGEREGFEVFNLAPSLRSYAESNRAFLHGFGRELGNGHWNQLGHKVAGELLARKLCGDALPRAGF